MIGNSRVYSVSFNHFDLIHHALRAVPASGRPAPSQPKYNYDHAPLSAESQTTKDAACSDTNEYTPPRRNAGERGQHQAMATRQGRDMCMKRNNLLQPARQGTCVPVRVQPVYAASGPGVRASHARTPG